MNDEKIFIYKLHSFAIVLVIILFALSIAAQEPNSEVTDKTSSGDVSEPAKQDASKLSKNFHYIFEMGGQYRDLDGERPSKFEEFGRVRQGLLFRRFRISANPADSPAFFRAMGRSPTEFDQQYFLDFGKYGKFRTTVEWLGIPHLYSRGSRSFFEGGNGVITVPDNIQTTLQNTASADLPAATQSLLSSAANVITVKTERETFSLKQKFNLTEKFSTRFNWLSYNRSGTKPLGTGTYNRVGTSAGDTFIVNSIELPEELDYFSNELTFGASYITKNWGVNFDYSYSVFDNDIPLLTFDNPFRITDFQATGSGGVLNRGLFSRGIISLPPGNDSHTINISGFVDLPKHTRLASAVAWSFWRQDEDFAPYTLNTAIVTGVPAGLDITSTDSLPASNLDGEVDVFSQDHLITTRPFKNWTFNAHFRRYSHENQTESILFPGYAAFGESFWRTNIAGLPIENEPFSFYKTNASAEAVWEVNKAFKWKVEYEWEGWVREHRQAGRTNEHTISTQFSYKPNNRISSKLIYLYSDRKPVNYNPGVKEFSLLRMFDQATRMRHDADWQWQWSINPKLGLSGTLGYFVDDFDQNFFGLVRYTQIQGGADMFYMPLDNVSIYINYGRERDKSATQLISKTAAPFASQNRWNRDEIDVLDNFGAGVTAFLLKERMLVDVNYVFSNAKTKTDTFNLGIPLANSVLNATASPFPNVRSRFNELYADVSHQFRSQWALGVRYTYQPYKLDDFALNGLSPYPFANISPSEDGRRFLLLDARNTGHNAHVVSLYIRFSNGGEQ